MKSVNLYSFISDLWGGRIPIEVNLGTSIARAKDGKGWARMEAQGSLHANTPSNQKILVQTRRKVREHVQLAP